MSYGAEAAVNRRFTTYPKYDPSPKPSTSSIILPLDKSAIKKSQTIK